MGRGEAEEARRRSREKGAVPRKGTGPFVHSVHEPVAPGPFVSGIATVISWTRCIDLVHGVGDERLQIQNLNSADEGGCVVGFRGSGWEHGRRSDRGPPVC
jgi:hypothetical protein